MRKQVSLPIRKPIDALLASTLTQLRLKPTPNNLGDGFMSLTAGGLKGPSAGADVSRVSKLTTNNRFCIQYISVF